jgi:hypothetical protein
MAPLPTMNERARLEPLQYIVRYGRVLIHREADILNSQTTIC